MARRKTKAMYVCREGQHSCEFLANSIGHAAKLMRRIVSRRERASGRKYHPPRTLPGGEWQGVSIALKGA